MGSEIIGCEMQIDLAALRLFMWPSTMLVEVGFSSFLSEHMETLFKTAWICESWSHDSHSLGSGQGRWELHSFWEEGMELITKTYSKSGK